MRTAAVALLALIQSPHSWVLEAEHDKLTLATAQRLTFPGDAGDLVLLCSPGSAKVRLIATSREFLGSARHRDIKYRVGGLAPRNIMWRYSNDQAAEPYDNKELHALLNSMVLTDEAIFRFTRFDNRSVDVTYSLTGAGEALDAWKGACGLPDFDLLKTDAG